MNTLINARRVMRPPPEMDTMPADCKWCGKKIGRGVLFSLGMDMGQPAVVCEACVTPPAIGERPKELVEGEW